MTVTQRADETIDRTGLEPREGTPIYLHLPFCAAKCHYCDFYSVPAEGQDVDGTLEAIVREIQLRAPRRPRTVFLGGGTPSLLEPRWLKRLLDELDRVTDFRSSALEVTAECNPESLDRDKAACLLDLGVRRLSIGFQSLRPETLALFGRVHDVQQSFAAFEAARAAGVRDLNVDLIYAVPGQRLEDWLRDLDTVLGLGPDHVSAYNLTFEEETLFKRWLDQGRLAPHPDEVELEFFWATRERLSSSGRRPYEISNFSLDGRHCRHNVNYWHNGEYVGIGPSAVGKQGLRRAGNVRNLGEYRRRILERGDALDWSESPSDGARLGETWWLGLRLTEGLSPVEAWSRAGLNPKTYGENPSAPIVRSLADQGWLEANGERWRLSQKGWPVADAVAREFLRLRDAPMGTTGALTEGG